MSHWPPGDIDVLAVGIALRRLPAVECGAADAAHQRAPDFAVELLAPRPLGRNLGPPVAIVAPFGVLGMLGCSSDHAVSKASRAASSGGYLSAQAICPILPEWSNVHNTSA